jgi:hypothetical protein
MKPDSAKLLGRVNFEHLAAEAPMKCLEPESCLSGYLDQELSSALRLAVATHLAGCRPCRRLIDELAKARGLASQLKIPEMSSAEWGHVEACLSQHIQKPGED